MQQNDLISRKALMEEIGAIECSQSCDFCVATNCRIGQIVKTAPAIEAAPVVHGQWIPLEYDGFADGNPVWDLWECSECREEHSGDEDTLTLYCPNCGAKMDGERRTDGSEG